MNYDIDINIIKKLNEKNIIFSKSNINEIDDILNVYAERMQWFKDKSIKQWSKYLIHHPKEEFEDVIKNGYLFTIKQNNEIIAVFQISTDSKFWEDEETPAFYIYKVVTKVGNKDIANYIFEICKNIAKKTKIRDFILE